MKKSKEVVLSKKNKISLFRPIVYLISVIAITFFTWLFLDDSEKVFEVKTGISESNFETLVARLTPQKIPVLSARKKDMAELGKLFFFDKRFSANAQVSCSTCHKPELAFTDGLQVSKGLRETSRNAQTIINAYANFWFFWDGRADSLASQALMPIENPNEHGISRSYVAKIINRYYKEAYTKIFGSWPKALNKGFPSHAMPKEVRPQLPIDISTYGIQTIGQFSILEKILANATQKKVAPAEELSTLIAAPSAIDSSWYQNWEKLDAEQKSALNEVFRNFGLAIEAYESGLVANDSPFDQFASRLASGIGQANSLGEGFEHEELLGLKIFLGKAQCTNCHVGANFTDQQFHNTGLIGMNQDGVARLDIGRAYGVPLAKINEFNCLSNVFTQKEFDDRKESESCRELPWLSDNNLELVGAFKTPTLRNLAYTAPYGHNGRFKNLREVLEHYNKPSSKKPAIGHREDSLKPLNLSDYELKLLEKFLLSLTSPITDLTSKSIISQQAKN
ncbi:MAG: cytochrome c peroxidase [Bdellovibrionota bacterium]